MYVTILRLMRTGKSTVSHLLSSPPHSLPLIDLDVLSRLAVAPGTSTLSTLEKTFGPDILLPSGSLDRSKLGEIIFNDPEKRKALNAIVHPAVRRLLYWNVVRCWFKGEKVVVVDAPLLVEAGLWRYCGAIMVVYCSESLQLQRLQSRNNFSPSEAQARLSSQAPLASKLPYADHVLDNSGDLSQLSPQVDRVVQKLRSRGGGVGWLVNWLMPPVGIFWGALRIAWRLGVKGVGKDRRAKHRTRGERLGGGGEEEIELQERRRRN